jgi:hypothetical protein
MASLQVHTEAASPECQQRLKPNFAAEADQMQTAYSYTRDYSSNIAGKVI